MNHDDNGEKTADIDLKLFNLRDDVKRTLSKHVCQSALGSFGIEDS
jgi:hypothetical protein